MSVRFFSTIIIFKKRLKSKRKISLRKRCEKKMAGKIIDFIHKHFFDFYRKVFFIKILKIL